MKGLFTLPYLGPISLYSDILLCDSVLFENNEHWQKQTYRNRCYIDSPNGLLMLNIPVEHTGSKKVYRDINVSYKDSWQLKHWQAIQTSYRSSPFFEVLAPELKCIYDKKFDSLYEMNWQLNRLICQWLQIKTEFGKTEKWEPSFEGFIDHRESHHPKKFSNLEMNVYPQVFDYKQSFKANLSILDLLFNEGPAAYDYLIDIQTK